MVKEINIGGRTETFSASAALPISYRRLTGRDFFADMQEMGTNGGMNDKVIDIAWVMYREANPDSSADEAEWLQRYDFADLFNEDTFVAIVTLITASRKTTSTPKKKQGDRP